MVLRSISLFSLAVGCGDPVTEVVIRLDAEPGSRDRGQFLAVEVTNGEGTVVRSSDPLVVLEERGESRWPITFGLVPEVSSRFDFRATLLDSRREPFAEVRHEGQYTEGQVVFVDLLFEDRAATVSAGFTHTCAIRDGQLSCFGSNEFGETGTGSPDDQLNRPTLVPGLWAFVATGIGATCALDQDDRLFCWGEASNVVSSRSPVSIDGERRFLDVSVAGDLVCTVDASSVLACRGADDDLRLGIDSVTGPPLPDTAVRMVRTSSWNTCAVTQEGALHCWGRDPGGSGRILDSASPVDERIYHNVAAGNGSAPSFGLSSFATVCAVGQDGNLFCMGFNSRGMLSDAGALNEHVPTMTQVGSRTDWATVCLGREHACGLHTDGTLECWGANGSGQLGIQEDDRNDRTVPTAVHGGRTWASVDCGATHTCGTTVDGAIYCWGSAGSARLGQNFGAMGRREVGQPVEVLLE